MNQYDEFIGSWIGGSWSACAQACAEKGWRDYLPLHLAAAHGASVAVVGRLLQHRPHAAAAKGGYGEWLPLHLALGAEYPNVIKASCEVIGMILDAHPQVCRHTES
eukprot:COSAG04_NODE_139_length_23663_cov_6.466893_7_plen_106_part_00